MSEQSIIQLAWLTLAVFIGLLLILAVAAWAVKNWRTIRGETEKHQVGPQPFMVQEADQYATKSELAAVKEDIAAVDADLKSLRQEIVVNGEKRRQSIEAKVEASRKESAAHIERVHTEIKHDMDKLREDIKNAPSETVALLRNTKGLL